MTQRINKTKAHEFALYLENLPPEAKKVDLKDKDLAWRIISVLRLTISESVILFSQKHSIRFTITGSGKGQVSGFTDTLQINTKHCPAVTLLLPILKKDALGEAIYGAVECGVTKIQLVITEKVQRKWGGQKEFERLQRIVIAAAEQSKSFAFAQLVEPISLQEALKKTEGMQLFFADPTGKLLQTTTKSCAILVGPEGDLTQSEKELVKSFGTQFFKLTPTILRAQQAAVLAVGIVRTLS